MTRRRTTTLVTTLATTGAMIAGLGAAVLSAPAAADDPGGALVDEVVWDDVGVAPTAIRFTPDGRVVVADLTGALRVYDSVDDPEPVVSGEEEWRTGQPTTLPVRVHNYLDRGLLGLEVDPDFPAEPYIYVSYAFNHRPGTQDGAVPAYVDGDQHAWDPCPEDGCAVDGRIERLTVDPDGSIDTTRPEVLVDEGFCFVHPSHTMGQLEFGDDGYLYASAGEGASYLETDAGQTSDNPCGDAPGEGGSLRSQDLRHGSDPVGLDGSLLRLDPDTGAGAPGNPLAGSADANARRILAHGMRNPFRFTVRTPPGGTASDQEVWIGDVGRSLHEEVNRIDVSAPVENFGWPCFEGPQRQPDFDASDLAVCEEFYDDADRDPGVHTPPWWSYQHNRPVLPDGSDTCSTESGSVSAVGFLDDPPYPARYDGALIVGDYTRRCLWMMPAGAAGEPDRGAIEELLPDPGHVVMVEQGPGGELWYVEIFTAPEPGSEVGGPGAIHRVIFDADNRAPTADVAADRTSGPAPLTVELDGSGSTDPDGDDLTYAWDLDGDGAHDDASGVRVTHTFTEPDPVTVSLRVSDPEGESDLDTIAIQPGNSPPVMRIETPDAATVTFGDEVTFSGSATDTQDGDLAASSISWVATIQHCPSECHQHPLQTFPQTDKGSFVVPEHDLPTHILLTATATDSRGLTHRDSVRLDLAAPEPEPDAPPTVQITSPADDATYTVGRRVRFAASAEDPETGALPPTATDWTLERVRCGVGGCTTTVLEQWDGVAEGSFRPGQQPQDARLRLSVTTRDPGGQEASDTVALTPRRSRQVFVGRGAPARLTVAGESARGRLVTRLVVGTRVRVVAPRAVRVRGERRRFVRWSHGERRRHVLVVPTRDARYVARYRR